MSLFDYPRINFAGIITLNPGTANNDDYAQQPSFKIPPSWGPPYAGQALGLIDSVNVEARTYGMSDQDFIAWVQKTQTFEREGKPQAVIPAEWNYYGVMNSTVKNAKVVGVQTGPGAAYPSDDGGLLSSLVGADLNFTGGITDINSEGSPPATQFFIDSLTLTQGGQTVISGVPSKGVCQQINFYRNANFQGDSGAGCYVYHVIPGAASTIAQFKNGIVFRYYLYRVLHHNSSNEELEKIYAAEKINPAPLQIAGTIAPLGAGEKILAAPTGRLLTWAHPKPNIPTDGKNPNPQQPPTQKNNGGGKVALAPAILHQSDDALSVDFIGTFPDYYLGPDSNDKFDFGGVTLQVTDGTESAPLGEVDYQDTEGGNSRGWLFDFELSDKAKMVLKNGGIFELVSQVHGPVLSETPYMIVSNQQAVYAEQGGPGDSFLNQGKLEPATVSVFQRGEELDAGSCPPITLWQYPATPIQDRGKRQLIDNNFKPGQAIKVDTSQPGNLLLTFTIDDPEPPQIYNQPPPPSQDAFFTGPPWVTNAPQISIRILPNGEDFSRYYQQPIVGEPVGNDDLTFEVVYEKVLRTYYLLFPGMNKHLSLGLDNKKNIIAAAPEILSFTEMDRWMTTEYMPRTRDLSRSRRELLRAWCRNPH